MLQMEIAELVGPAEVQQVVTLLGRLLHRLALVGITLAVVVEVELLVDLVVQAAAAAQQTVPHLQTLQLQVHLLILVLARVDAHKVEILAAVAQVL